MTQLEFCLISLILASSHFSFAQDETATSDENSEYIQIEAKGILHHGSLEFLDGKYGTTITANGVTWQLELPRMGRLTSPKYLELVKSLKGKLVVVKGMLRQEGNGKTAKFIVKVFDLEKVPISISLSLEADPKGNLEVIRFKKKTYKNVEEIRDVIKQLKDIDLIVLDCDSRLKYGHVIEFVTLSTELGTKVKIRQRDQTQTGEVNEEEAENKGEE